MLWMNDDLHYLLNIVVVVLTVSIKQYVGAMLLHG